jgi:hypothetical protein
MPLLSARLTRMAKTMRCTSPLAYCSLYIAPTPGMNPRKPASSGLGDPMGGCGGMTPEV